MGVAREIVRGVRWRFLPLLALAATAPAQEASPPVPSERAQALYAEGVHFFRRIGRERPGRGSRRSST